MNRPAVEASLRLQGWEPAAWNVGHIAAFHAGSGWLLFVRRDRDTGILKLHTRHMRYYDATFDRCEQWDCDDGVFNVLQLHIHRWMEKQTDWREGRVRVWLT